MRLINTATLQLESFPRFDRPQIPPYAILSHRWGADEISLQEMQTPTPSLTSKLGYQKVVKCSAVAASFGFEYIWIDTCCIDKTNNVELTEAINSMFNYYRDADVCYAYLADVPSDDDASAEGSGFRRSSWFTRGWTLQELIAPENVVFYGGDWRDIGTKSSLEKLIAEITLISPYALNGYGGLSSKFSVAQKMAWASNRQTERIEDMAYCLMGLFGVNMPLIYGEGQNAFKRLQLELLKESVDQSIFAWRAQIPTANGFRRGLLAYHPAEFRDGHDIVRENTGHPLSEFSMTNVGLKITLPLLDSKESEVLVGPVTTFIAILGCVRMYQGLRVKDFPRLKFYGIYLNLVGGMYTRTDPDQIKLVGVNLVRSASNHAIYVPQVLGPHFPPRQPTRHWLYVFQRRLSPLSDIRTSDPGNHNFVPWKLGNDEVKLKFEAQGRNHEAHHVLLFKYNKGQSACAVYFNVYLETFSHLETFSYLETLSHLETFSHHIQADMGLEDFNQLKAGNWTLPRRGQLASCDRSSIVLHGGQILYFAVRQGYADGNRARFVEVSVDGDFQLVQMFERLRLTRTNRSAA
ncbi:heterokaryon incompatibility protein-domain-containing protein [Leptodontidium sp. MPI-SDFR-AT-0119]|nr:heterokaryon incompatibility protein-domain-containing protein [Leptodontidium sp. MPI-SDFR-AT-0119]